MTKYELVELPLEVAAAIRSIRRGGISIRIVPLQQPVRSGEERIFVIIVSGSIIRFPEELSFSPRISPGHQKNEKCDGKV